MPGWLNDLLSFLKSDLISATANISSIAGLIITIFVMRTVGQLRTHYVSMVRLPELRTQLQKQASQLGDLLNDFAENENQITLELAKTSPILSAINKRLKRSERTTINGAIKILNGHESHILTEVEVRSVYNSLHTISGELEQWEYDKKWSA